MKVLQDIEISTEVDFSYAIFTLSKKTDSHKFPIHNSKKSSEVEVLQNFTIKKKLITFSQVYLLPYLLRHLHHALNLPNHL